MKELDRGNRFKFIERTERIESHRGIKADDGLVRIEFKREKVYEPPQRVEHHTYHHHTYHPWYWWYPRHYPYGTWCSALQSKSFNADPGTLNVTASWNVGASTPVAAMNMMRCSVENDAGITVAGSVSDQKFVNVSGFETEQSEVLVLHLVGRKGQAVVQAARTVQTKLVCPTCGKKNRSLVKFCPECGTSLEQV